MIDDLKSSGRIAGRVSRLTSRLARHRILLGFGVGAFFAFLAYIAWVSVEGPPFSERYEVQAVIPADAPVIEPGDTVRMAGRLAGFVTEVDPEPGEEAFRLTAQIRPEFSPIGEDATASVRVRSLVYLTYLDIQPGDRDEQPLADGGTIPLTATGSKTDLLEVVQLFDAETRRTLSASTRVLGQGVAGRGDELNRALADLNPVLRDGTPQLKAIARRPGAISDIVSGTAATASGLRGVRPDDVAGLISGGSAVLGATARQSPALGEAIEQLRPFEDELLRTAPLADPVLKDTEALARRLTPAVRRLNGGLRRLDGLLARGKVLRGQVRKLVRPLSPVLRLARRPLRDLYTTAAAIDPLLASLDSIVATLDPYQSDIQAAGEGAIDATKTLYPEGQTAPNTSALRFSPVLTCERKRNPFPAPGTSVNDRESC